MTSSFVSRNYLIVMMTSYFVWCNHSIIMMMYRWRHDSCYVIKNNPDSITFDKIKWSLCLCSDIWNLENFQLGRKFFLASRVDCPAGDFAIPMWSQVRNDQCLTIVSNKNSISRIGFDWLRIECPRDVRNRVTSWFTIKFKFIINKTDFIRSKIRLSPVFII